MEGGLLLDVVVRESATVFELLAGEDEALLVGWDAFPVLDCEPDGMMVMVTMTVMATMTMTPTLTLTLMMMMVIMIMIDLWISVFAIFV